MYIDIAHAHQNKRSVGKAIKDSGVSREKIWLTSKLWSNKYGKGKTLKAIKRMKNSLGVKYIDLVLFLLNSWGLYKCFVEIKKTLKNGKVMAIDIPNFDFDENVFLLMIDNAKVKP